jgi:hypothetical protein
MEHVIRAIEQPTCHIGLARRCFCVNTLNRQEIFGIHRFQHLFAVFCKGLPEGYRN